MLTRMLNQNRIFIAALALLLCAQAANAQSTAFTYQGKLTDAGNPATSSYDIQFKLFDTPTDGTQQGATLTNPTVQVTAGIFTVELDFGAGVFDGAARYLEICIRPAGSPDPYTMLAPRQPVTSTPYAMHSMKAAAADGLSVSCVNCITSSQIQTVDGAQVTGSIAGEQITGSIPVESVPVGSSNYIQNAAAALRAGRPAVRQVGDFDLTGDGTLGGTLSANVVNTATRYNIGGNSVLSLGAGVDNLFVGPFAGQANPTGSANSFFGVSAGFRTSTGSANSFFGRSAGFQNMSGNDNSFFGVQAGRDNSTGGNNSFFGRAAGIGNTSGGDNSYFGAYTGQAVSAGNANSFFGVSAGFNNTGEGNAFFGRSAGFQNTTGFSNSFFGTQAGRDNLSGMDNSFFGRVAGIGNHTGSNNTIIGSNANVGSSNLFNATAIGANAVVSQSNSLVLGSSNVKVGIGTSTPTSKLEIVAQDALKITGFQPFLTLSDTNAAGKSGFVQSFNGDLILLTNSRAALVVKDIDGMVSVNSLQIVGGGDFSENFDVRDAKSAGAGAVSKEIEQGLLVSIDQENPGKLVVSQRAYDRSVAGIISGAGGISPGLVMGQKGSIADGKHPVALSGRVWAYCDARRNPIKPGDLLTTSATPGHAMKVRNYAKAQGAIIGKAMTALKGGRGMVLVLVSLQ